MSRMKEYAFRINHPITWVKGDGAGLKKTPKPKVVEEAPKVEQKGESNMDILYEENRKLAQEAFDMSQCHGTASTADKFEWYNDRGVELPLVDAETIIENNDDKVEAIASEVPKLEASVEKLEAVKAPPWVIKREQRRLEYLSNLQESLIKQTNELEDEIDTKLADKDTDYSKNVYVPFHWQQAKAYWERILTFCYRNESTLRRHHLLALYKKVALAKQAHSISSWYYFQLAYFCTCKLNMPQERIKLLNYAVACKSGPFEGSMWSKPREDSTLRAKAQEALFWAKELNPDGLLEIQRGEDLSFILPDGSYLEGSCITVKYVFNNGEVI